MRVESSPLNVMIEQSSLFVRVSPLYPKCTKQFQTSKQTKQLQLIKYFQHCWIVDSPNGVTWPSPFPRFLKQKLLLLRKPAWDHFETLNHFAGDTRPTVWSVKLLLARVSDAHPKETCINIQKLCKFWLFRKFSNDFKVLKSALYELIFCLSVFCFCQVCLSLFVFFVCLWICLCLCVNLFVSVCLSLCLFVSVFFSTLP